MFYQRRRKYTNLSTQFPRHLPLRDLCGRDGGFRPPSYPSSGFASGGGLSNYFPRLAGVVMAYHSGDELENSSLYNSNERPCPDVAAQGQQVNTI